jgi:ubiquinone/menaquinone biosynthesis C-methylase UbiE
MPNETEEFNKIASEIFAPIYPVIAGQIIKKTGINKGICLDIGSASGHLGKAISSISDLYVFLMDDSYDALCIAEKQLYEKNQNLRFKITYGDVHKIPFGEESVNLVVSRGSLWFWQDKKKAIEEIYRVMAKGGFAYIGGGFGNKELKEKISVRMTELNNEKWEDRMKRIRGECTKEYLDKLLSEMKLPFEIIDDDSGLWVVISKIK